ncbi:MAG: PBP1A family penicillin-binding protein [Clostridia bacterium]|nr:PBP1A family penicillin-binding protein [Deltaproteobacteria bacterium]
MSNLTVSNFKKALLIIGGAALAGLIFLVVGYFALKAGVPAIRNLSDYNPTQVSRIYSDDGELVGELFVEKRIVVPYDAIPQHVVHAFLAAEDAAFFEHGGLDYMGMLRAALMNLRPGAHLQGASTITQQTVKTFVLGPERSITRKLREIILSRELEDMLSKEDILALYLNQIYFGASAYGIEEAARTYFGKSVRDVDLGEAALLAAIPKNPSHYTPRTDREAAKQRQKYVLTQMQEKGWADEATVKTFLARPIPPALPPPPYLGRAPHYVEHVRKLLVEHYGEERIQHGGLTIYTGMNAKAQVAAQDAMRSGLEDVARNQGFKEPSLRVEVDRYDDLISFMHGKLDDVLQKNPPKNHVVWDLRRVTGELLTNRAELAKVLRTAPLVDGTRVTAVVSEVSVSDNLAWLDLGTERGRMLFKSMSWARKFSPTSRTTPPKNVSDVLRKGDIVQVQIVKVPTRLKDDKSKTPFLEVELVPEPQVEGAIVAIDPQTRFVRAMVGGYDQERGTFNRATQARRQPGSSFKPIVYATGLNESVITPATICPDSPVAIRDEWTGKVWRPSNFEDNTFDGNITYRTALMRSKNTCSVKLMEKLGPDKVIAMAHALGVQTELPRNLTLALGSGDVSPLELTNAYASIAAGGQYAAPIFIRKVVDTNQSVLEDTQAVLTQVMRPSVAYVITQMMRSVVEEGTATRALVLDRPLAGKTGTSNEARNTWFGGFSPELAAMVWVGFDDNSPQGRATGGSHALPIWIRFMGRALDGVPRRDFAAPPDVVFFKVDGDTGEPSEDVGSIEEVFVAGTEPTAKSAGLKPIFDQDVTGTGPN